MFSSPEPSRCRSCGRNSVVVEHSDYIYGVDSLTAQFRRSRYGLLAPELKKLPDSQYDEDDSMFVDPSSNPSLDRFERTEEIARAISDRMKKSKKDALEHAES